eukprot:CAMPEP_0171473118 /NCGR_PEP_ID=MMETSP0946-20130122/1657_1 /TAXON_ID=109269 /ORGANISM="Vaucheria litorea, Strain CCMP2940" /LENGTH=133 /DNA_ID=CAMNT_0012002833 /DNA_START=216 /DNA_END=617 /DNA_ORIENTATION=-
MDTFEEAVGKSQSNRLVVIKAFVPWCRACKAFDQKFRKLGLDLESQGAPVTFYEVDVFAVKDVKNLLDIKLAPSIVMYINGNQIDNFSCGPKKFDQVVEKISGKLSELSGAEGAFKMPQVKPEKVVENNPPDL